jgi:hypothetical protein
VMSLMKKGLFKNWSNPGQYQFYLKLLRNLEPARGANSYGGNPTI